MIEYNFGALQNGSDIRGVAMEVPGGKPVNLGDVATARLAKGFLFWLSNKTGKKPSEITVSIGRDSRLTGPELGKCIRSREAEALKRELLRIERKRDSVLEEETAQEERER